VPYAVAYDDIRNGALKMVACRSAPYSRGCRLVVRRGKEGMSKIARLRAWLKDEVAEMQRSLESPPPAPPAAHRQPGRAGGRRSKTS
jgi:LysR family glycine cleavage system transcriptional activator